MRLAGLACLVAALTLSAAHVTSGSHAKASSLRTEQQATGKRAFQKCFACHSLEGGGSAAQGPSLRGIVGAPVAGERGFEYSSAMRDYARQQPRWTRDALDAFLADPYEVVPDTEMGFFGIKNSAERAALIDYLEAQ